MIASTRLILARASEQMPVNPPVAPWQWAMVIVAALALIVALIALADGR